MTGSPTFTIGAVPIYGALVLAPLSGFTDSPYRALCREFGAALSYTPLLDAEALAYHSQRTQTMLTFAPEETPLVFQLFGGDEESLLTAAQTLERHGATIIDLNMGCAVEKVTTRGAGAALLRDQKKISRIISHLRKALAVPITAKIRIGWDTCNRNALTVARILEESGAALVAIHGRTATQTYQEPADWDTMAEIKQAVRIPVIGNGDVHHVDDIARMKTYTHCDGVMIGRAAIGNPWIFSQQEQEAIPLAERCRVMQCHLARMVAHYGPDRGFDYFHKHMVRYLRGLKSSRQLKKELLAIQDTQALLNQLASLAATS